MPNFISLSSILPANLDHVIRATKFLTSSIIIPFLVAWVTVLPALRQLKVSTISERQKSAIEIVDTLVEYRSNLVDSADLARKGALSILGDKPVPNLRDLFAPLGVNVAMEFQKLNDTWRISNKRAIESHVQANEFMISNKGASAAKFSNSIAEEINKVVSQTTLVINATSRAAGLPYKL